MLRLLLVSVIALTLGAPDALAQRLDRAQQRADRIEHRVEVLREALGLTDAQAMEVRRLFHVQAAEHYDRSGDREAHRARMAERHAEMGRRIEALLTPYQIERFHAWREEHKQRSRREQQRISDGENVLI